MTTSDRPVKIIRLKSRLTKAAFSRHFGIPIRTLENWENPGPQYRKCPDYLIKLLELGVKFTIPTEVEGSICPECGKKISHSGIFYCFNCGVLISKSAK